MNLLEEIKSKEVPKHIAIIMDGNGRWAQQHGKERIFGHQSALDAVRDTVEAAAEVGIKYLTLYAFSTENWNRPVDEVQALMELLVSAIHQELPTLQKNNIRLLTIGDTESLPEATRSELKSAMDQTADNTHMDLVLALSYSARWEILNAVKTIISDVKNNKLKENELDEESFSNYLSTQSIPDPELMIRTSGEYRVSNFLLWQLAYSEFYFLDKLWPDFRKADLFGAIHDFQNRERRFGKTGDQINKSLHA